MSTGNYYCDGCYQWDAKTLWKAAEDPANICRLELRPREDLLAYVMFSDFEPLMTFEATFSYFQRVMDADLSFPIILYWEEPQVRDGTEMPAPIILDGFHRTMKALITRQPIIKGIRLLQLPKYDRYADTCQATPRCSGCEAPQEDLVDVDVRAYPHLGPRLPRKVYCYFALLEHSRDTAAEGKINSPGLFAYMAEELRKGMTAGERNWADRVLKRSGGQP